MLTALFKSIGLVEASEPVALMPRQINISGNIVHFSMPENFSRDFPAKNLIEQVDLGDEEIFEEYGSALLMQRWWDFKTGGFFKKEIGTVMMTIKVVVIAKESPANLSNPLEFAEVIREKLRDKYDAFNASVNADDGGSRVFYSNDLSTFLELEFGRQRWVSYVYSPESGKTNTIAYAIPVTARHYLVMEFASAPVDGVHVRTFIDEHTQAFTDKIMSTVEIQYSPSNAFVKEIEGNANLKLEDMVKELSHDTVLPVYRP